MELVKLFCDYNANLNHQGKASCEAVTFQSRFRLSIIMGVSIPLYTFQNGWTPFMEAARGGFKDIVEELAKRGADLNMKTVRTL